MVLGSAASELSRSFPCLPLSTFGGTEGHECGRGRTHLHRERVRLNECCCAPQAGITPLHRAAMNGHAAVVEQLLAVGAVNHATTEVTCAGEERCI